MINNPDVFFCLTKSPKPKDTQFTIRQKKQQMLTVEKLEPNNVLLPEKLHRPSVIKMVGD